MQSSLFGKLALITGASGTLGLSIAKALVKAGADVVLAGRNMKKLTIAANAIRSSLATDAEQASRNARIDCIVCDVTREESVEQLFERIEETQYDKSVDILVNNAGTSAHGETTALSAKDFQSVMEVNVLGPFLCSKFGMQNMKKAGGGRIINIGSISSQSPRPHSAPYTTSKFALDGLTKCLALDGREHNILVSTVHPGNIKSDLLTPEIIERRGEEGFLDPCVVADCVLSIAAAPNSTNILNMTVIPAKQPLVGRG